MHQPTRASSSLRAVAHTVSLTTVLFCLHGIFTDYELFTVMWAGFDLFIGVYTFGIIVAVVTSISLLLGWPRLEYACMSISIWLYALVFLFSALVTSLHSPIIVISFGLAIVNVVLATHIKKEEIDGEEDTGSNAESEDQLQSGIPGSD